MPGRFAVRPLVAFEGAQLPEGAAAGAARVGPLPGVGAEVHVQVPLVAEGPRARVTAEGPLVGVGPAVRAQRGVVGEPPWAECACEGPLAGVGALVHAEVRGLEEALVAEPAGEGPLPGVCLLVHAELRAVPKPFAALPALEPGRTGPRLSPDSHSVQTCGSFLSPVGTGGGVRSSPLGASGALVRLSRAPAWGQIFCP